MEPGFWTPRIVMHKWLHAYLSGVMRSRVLRYARCFHNDSDTTRLDGLLNANGDLLCESLLNLQPTAEGLCNPRKLGQAENELIRNIGYSHLEKSVSFEDGFESGEKIYLACKGDEVVLAQARHVNVTDQDHLVMIFCENSVIDYICQGTLPFSDVGRRRFKTAAPASRSSYPFVIHIKACA